MAAIAVTDERARAFIKKMLKQTSEVHTGGRKYITALSGVVFKDVIDHFNQERGPDGPWQPWSRMYAEHMKAIGKGNNKILQDTGRLRNSFVPRNVRRVSEGILWYNPAKVRGFPYAAAHDEGEGKLPARPFMWLSEAAQENILNVTLGFILENN